MRHAATFALLSRQRRHHRRVGVVHLRHRRPRDLRGDDVRGRRRHRRSIATRCCAGSSSCSTSATTSTSTAARSACAATPSRCSRPTRPTPRSASSGSATRSRRSARSIRCAAASSASSTARSIFAASHYATPEDTMRRAVAERSATSSSEQLERAVAAGQAARAPAPRAAHDVRPRDRSSRWASAPASRTTRATSPGATPGEPPPTLIDYFRDDYLLIVDESHQTVPQIGAMYSGDRSRKETLVEFGFRLPSALDNRPLRFDEWRAARAARRSTSRRRRPTGSSTQAKGVVVEQIIRPTGLLDPEVEVRPVAHQVDDLLAEIRERTATRRARAGHHADQAHGRGPDRVLPRDRRQGPLPALRRRHARAHPDHPRSAARRVRRARRHQPAARGPRHPRGLARRHPRRRQGRLPALASAR